MTKTDWLNEYSDSVTKSDEFWSKQSKRLDWIKPWKTLTSGDFDNGNIKWFEEGELNVCYNCVDRHLAKRADKPAIIWEGDNPSDSKVLSYQQLYNEVCKFANTLKKIGIKKGDVVCIYMPMIPEAAIAMLACARIGAIHSVIFAGFSSESIESRIQDASCKLVITADGSYRAGKQVHLKRNVDQAVKNCQSIQSMLVIKNTNMDIDWNEKLDIDYTRESQNVPKDCPVVSMNAEDPMFILYTSGSTGTPKGVLHTTAGYLLYASLTHEKIFDLKEDDVYWCTADVGWITGHSYLVYGPLANGASTLMFEGGPTYPNPSRFFEVVDKHKVTIFYTAPTAIRLLMSFGKDAIGTTTRKSLRLLGTVGEPINIEAWSWYHDVVGNKKCPIVDTWWQTETGGILISPSSKRKQKPGSAMFPFLGIEPVLLDKKTGKEISGALEKHDYGALAIKKPWPGMMRTVYGDHQRFMKTYLQPYKGYYYPADGAYRDDNGDYWITGRLDDVLNVAGHRLGTAEIEDAINHHQSVAESAIVGIPDQIKGEAIYAFITLNHGVDPSDKLAKEIRTWVREHYGPIAVISYIQWSEMLPKTRSGKIMRRILRKISHFEENQIGDTSTLADSRGIKDLIKNRIDYRSKAEACG